MLWVFKRTVSMRRLTYVVGTQKNCFNEMVNCMLWVLKRTVSMRWLTYVVGTQKNCFNETVNICCGYSKELFQ